MDSVPKLPWPEARSFITHTHLYPQATRQTLADRPGYKMQAGWSMGRLGEQWPFHSRPFVPNHEPEH